MKKSRLMASLLCVVLLAGALAVPAYAGGGEEYWDGTGGVELWEGLDPVEPTSEPDPEPNPLTPDGTGTVVDNATDADGKEFFTITTADEAVFYLVIDRQKSTENVYFLNAVTVADLLALAESSGAVIPVTPDPEPEPAPEPTPEPEPEPEAKGGGAGMLLVVLAVVGIGGGAGWYFKIYRPKQQKAAEPEEDYDEADYGGPEDYEDDPPWDGDGEEPEE